MNKNKVYFLLIIILAFFLRFFRLGYTPSSLYWDEVSLGYNAYSILKTGKDEFGIKFPIDKFIAFGDYKPIGYIYADVIPILIFGLNEFAVRFPSALAGTLMVVLTYFLVKKLFDNEFLALVSAILLGISPWSLHLSRVAFEANLAAFFNLLAIFLFVKGMKDKQGYCLIIAPLFLVAAFYTFNSNRILMPLIILILILVYFKNVWKNKKWIFAGLVLAFILLLPLLPYLRSRESRLRYDEVNIFSDLNVIVKSNGRITFDGNTRLAKIIHHRWLGHISNFLKHYFDHFSGDFLFISGDVNPRLSVRSVGELYLVELPFFLIGFYWLLVNLRNKQFLLIFLWFLAALIPAAVARETPHALRIVSVLPTPQILSALGFYKVFIWLQSKKYRLLIYLSLSLLFLINFGYYLYNYYLIFPKIYAGEWLDGYKQAVEKIKMIEQKYDKIYITNYYNRPYIYFLFYNNYSPEKYFNQVKKDRDWFGNWTVHSFDKFDFSDTVLSKEKGKVLFLASPNTVVANFNKIGEIKNIDNKAVFWLLEK